MKVFVQRRAEVIKGCVCLVDFAHQRDVVDVRHCKDVWVLLHDDG